jgi:glutamine synthetase type III
MHLTPLDKDSRKTRGLTFFVKIFAGISNATYDTKKTHRAVFSCHPFRCRSVGNRKSIAFPMFTLNKGVSATVAPVVHHFRPYAPYLSRKAST